MIRRLESLPTFPGVCSRLLALMEASAAEAMGRTIEMIRLDPALAARVLSAAGRMPGGPARTVRQAGQAVGIDGIRAIVLTAGPLPPDQAVEGGLDWAGHWKHCLATAIAAERLAAAATGQIDPDEAYVCGLLHDIGKLVLAQAMPKSYGRVLAAAGRHNGDVAAYERRILGTDHCVVGRRLAEHWRLSTAVRQVNWLAHQPIEAIPASASHTALIGVVKLADTLARELELGFSGNFTSRPTSRQLAGHLGIGSTHLRRLATGLAGMVDQQFERLGAVGAGDETACRRALIEANARLGRWNESLTRQREGLRRRAGAFEQLGGLLEGLTGEDSVTELLCRVADTTGRIVSRAASPSRPIVAYTAECDGQAVQAVRYDGSAEPTCRRFERAASAVAHAQDPCRPGPAPDALTGRLTGMAGLGEWMDASAYVHRPLDCAGRWIGGVFYPLAGEEGEAMLEALGPVVALALATGRARSEAIELSEELAGTSRSLAAAQEALAEAKTLSAVGQMAAGAAHELNNPLAVISGRAQLMCERAATEAEKAAWRVITEQAERISDIISELMACASPPAPSMQSVAVGKLLAGAAEAFCSSDHPKAAAARVDIQCREDVPPVKTDGAQMEAVLVELMANAATAAESVPNIRLTAEADEVDNAVLVSIRDDGPGMDPETLAGAFTPFFSAQQAGRRRGLGLPRARRTVEANGGRIWIHGEPGRGTTVRVQLPCA